MGGNNFKQISAITVWNYKKKWNIEYEKNITDIKKLHYGLFISDDLVAFVTVSIKNNELFFHIYEKNSTQASFYHLNIIQYVIRKAILFKKSRVSCIFNKENSIYFEQLGFESFYSNKYAEQIFSLSTKKPHLIEFLN